jgi:hypothetical protein
MKEVEVPLDSELFKRMRDLHGQDILEIVALLYTHVYSEEEGGKEKWNELDDLAKRCSYLLAETINAGSEGIIDQMVVTGMTICNLMTTFLGHFDWLGGLMEIDELTGDLMDLDASAMNDDTDGPSFNPLPGNDR